PTHSLVWCLALALAAHLAGAAVSGEPIGPLLALAVLAGSLSHVLADGLTVAGGARWSACRPVGRAGAAGPCSSAPWPSGPGAGPRPWWCSAWSPGSATGSRSDSTARTWSVTPNNVQVGGLTSDKNGLIHRETKTKQTGVHIVRRTAPAAHRRTGPPGRAGGRGRAG